MAKKGKKGKGKKGKKAAPVANQQQCADVVPMDAPCKYSKDTCCTNSLNCRPNSYPGMLTLPTAMAVVGSECGSYDSICRLLRAGFRCADRVFVMTPWGNYVVFRMNTTGTNVFFIFDGCTCNVNRFRYMDLNCGTAGLQYYDQMHLVVNYIIDSKLQRDQMKSVRKTCIDDVCRDFCEQNK